MLRGHRDSRVSCCVVRHGGSTCLGTRAPTTAALLYCTSSGRRRRCNRDPLFVVEFASGPARKIFAKSNITGWFRCNALTVLGYSSTDLRAGRAPPQNTSGNFLRTLAHPAAAPVDTSVCWTLRVPGISYRMVGNYSEGAWNVRRTFLCGGQSEGRVLETIFQYHKRASAIASPVARNLLSDSVSVSLPFSLINLYIFIP